MIENIGWAGLLPILIALALVVLVVTAILQIRKATRASAQRVDSITDALHKLVEARDREKQNR